VGCPDVDVDVEVVASIVDGVEVGDVDGYSLGTGVGWRGVEQSLK
jgi:hypothetical protein